MEGRKASWYSIVRYCPDQLTGEVINVGLILHSIEDSVVIRYRMLEENSAKIRAVTNSQVDISTYKSFRDILEYYLQNCVSNLFGAVGSLQVAPAIDEDFLQKLAVYYEKSPLYLTRPKYALTADMDLLFNKIFETYVGKKYANQNNAQVGAKKYIRNIFEEKQLLHKKVASDFVITPIEGPNNLKLNIDFAYKNGVWNYMQAVPVLHSSAKNTEWFAKTKFMLENIDGDANVHLLFRQIDCKENEDLGNLMDYLVSRNERVSRLNIDNQSELERLCKVIARDAHDLDTLKIS